MKRTTTATALAIVLLLLLSTSITAAPQPQMFAQGPLTAHVCNDAVCLNWNVPANIEYDFLQIIVWHGDDHIVTASADYNSHARLPLNILKLFLGFKHPGYSGDTVDYTFKVFALKNSYVDSKGWTVHQVIGVWKTDVVTITVPYN